MESIYDYDYRDLEIIDPEEKPMEEILEQYHIVVEDVVLLDFGMAGGDDVISSPYEWDEREKQQYYYIAKPNNIIINRIKNTIRRQLQIEPGPVKKEDYIIAIYQERDEGFYTGYVKGIALQLMEPLKNREQLRTSRNS